MPLTVEPIPPKWTFGIVNRVFALAVNAFERVGHSSSAFVLSLEGFVLKFALQHHASSLWCSTL